MQTISRPSGIVVTVPDTWTVEQEAEAPRRRTRGIPGRVFGPVPVPAGGESIADDLVSALESQDMVLVDRIPLRASPASPSAARAAPKESSESGTLHVDLEADESAVVLLEQDGMFSWNFPTSADALPHVSRQIIRHAPTGGRAHFELSFGTAAPAGVRRRGLVSDFLFGQAKALVFKFAARVVAENVASFLERKVRRGLVLMDSNDPQSWPLVEDLSEVPLPKDRPARILLFVHGTFSSTAGSFGALGTTPWGRSFLEGVAANYDAVIGFDHATLSEDPLQNASDLLRRLQSAQLQHSPRIDAISYSRGGIVLRSLLEHLLPHEPRAPVFERSVFVGAVNDGTLLAEPDNWHTLIDLYTNLAAAACRIVGLMPNATAGAFILREAIQGVGTFAKCLATESVTEAGIPGLAAMEPEGEFIRRLNETQPGQPTAVDAQFFAVTSDFSPHLVPESASDLPRQLVLTLANGLVDQLMGEANDLVVNSGSVTRIDPQAGQFIKDQLDFGNNGVVYHTNYFLQPQTVNALARWFHLQLPQLASPARSRTAVRPGGMSLLDVPVSVDTNVYVVRADAPFSIAREETFEARPSHVVVERFYHGKILHYALPAEELLAHADAPANATVQETLHLSGCDASPCGPAWALPLPNRLSRHPTAQRVVALEKDLVVGVVPESIAPLPAFQLAQLAARIAGAEPELETTFIERRRGLPTFAPPPLPMAPPPPAPATAIEREEGAEPSKVTVHFCAVMDEEVEFGSIASIELTISREMIEQVMSIGVAGGKGEVEPGRKLIVLVVPKQNFTCVGENRAEVNPPERGKPIRLYFDVRPTSKCEGEIWIVVRQGQVPLVTLALKPRIVAKRSPSVRRLTAPASTCDAPELIEPVHELSIFEQRNLNKDGEEEVRYHFIFDSPALGLKNSYLSPPLGTDRVRYVNALYEEIEKRWVSNRDDTEAFHEELRAFGGQLWDDLIPAGLQRDLWENRDRIRSVWVFSEEPFIPWELVHLKEPGHTLRLETRFLAQIGLIRWLHNIGLPPQHIRLSPERCFHVIPDYPHRDYKLADARKEEAFLASQLKSRAVDPFPNPVRKLLTGPGAFDLLHFACHGLADHENISNAQLILQGRLERGSYVPDYLSATTVEQFSNLAGPDGNRPAVFINACQAGRAGYKLSGIGGFARAFLKHEAGLFVGTLWSVGDSPARQFTEEFYRRLLAGDRLAEAAIAGREKSRKAGEATWLAYVVYGHPHATVTSGQLSGYGASIS